MIATLAHRRWILRDRPYPHVVVDDVFPADVHAALTAEFRALLRRGLSEHSASDRFSRITGFDAYALPFSTHMGAALGLFTSRSWHDLLAGVFDVAATGDVRGSLHHHRAGSRAGTVHNDLNPGFFAQTPSSDTIVLPDPDLCSYHYGEPQRPGATVRPTVRAVAVLYYLCNRPWTTGDGGETALYRGPRESLASAAVTVAPVNNSMLAFACTPQSYHAFLANPISPRNSVIMWLHRPWDDAVRRWGLEAIVRWPRQ